MLEKVHEHMIAEIEQGNRTDTIVVVVTLLFNLITLCGNSTIATLYTNVGSSTRSAAIGINLYLAVFVLLTICLNAIAFIGMLSGRKAREKLLSGLVSMYSDNDVDKYYDKSLINTYRMRYFVFGSIMILFALASIAVPLILRLFQL